MITIFNRTELTMTYSIEEQTRVRNILADNNIDYAVKIHSPMSGTSQRRSSGFIPNPDYMYEYHIYVRKKDLDYALHLIHQ